MLRVTGLRPGAETFPADVPSRRSREFSRIRAVNHLPRTRRQRGLSAAEGTGNKGWKKPRSGPSRLPTVPLNFPRIPTPRRASGALAPAWSRSFDVWQLASIKLAGSWVLIPALMLQNSLSKLNRIEETSGEIKLARRNCNHGRVCFQSPLIIDP